MADVLNFLLASLEAGLALVVLRHLARFGRAFPWLAALMAFFFLRAADRFYVALAGDEPLAFSLLVDGLAVVLLALLLFGIERMIRRADEREELVALNAACSWGRRERRGECLAGGGERDWRPRRPRRYPGQDAQSGRAAFPDTAMVGARSWPAASSSSAHGDSRFPCAHPRATECSYSKKYGSRPNSTWPGNLGDARSSGRCMSAAALSRSASCQSRRGLSPRRFPVRGSRN